MSVGPDPVEFNPHPLLVFISMIAGATICLGFFKAMTAACRMVATIMWAGQ